MVSTEEILITMLGKDEVTPVVNNIQGNVNSTFNGMSQSAVQGANSIGQAYQSTFDQIGRGISSLNQGLMGISSVSNMVLREFGGTKSASDYVYGTSAVAETNKVLMRSWADTKVSYQDLYDTVDHVTDNSLTSMQELVPAMNAFRASTGASATQLKDDVTESMAQFGAYVKALTGSDQLAKTAMTDLSKGLVGKGSFNAVDQYGVTRASLEARGWSGENEDIKGYMEAVRDVAGQVEELMKTPEGASARLGKMWSRAGKKIGQEALPFVVNLKNAFMDLDDELDGNLSTTILRVSLYIDEAQQKLYMFNTMWQGVKNVSEAFTTLKTILGFTKVEEEANNLMQEENNRLVQESNLALAENNELRLANAEMMGYQNVMSQGQSYGGGYGGVPTGEESEEGSWGTDVLANTAGGLLQDRYDKLRYGNGNSLEDELAQNRSGDRSRKVNISDALGVVNETNALSQAEKDIVKRNLMMRQVASELGYSEEFTQEIFKEIDKASINPSDYMKANSNSVVGGFLLSELPNSAVQEQALKDYQKNQDSLKNELGNVIKSREDLNNMNTGHMGASVFNKLLQEEKEISDELGHDLPVDEAGPFTRLKNWLKTANRVEVTDEVMNGMDKLDSNLSQTGDKLTSKISVPIARLKIKFGAVKRSLTGLKGESKTETLDNIWDGLRNTLTGLRGGATTLEETAVEMGEMATTEGAIATEAGVLATESEVAGGEMAVADTGLTFMGLAEMGLVGAFTTLITPTLAIAGVIAILIPIIAGLVAEALYFAMLVGQFMSSLNFNFKLDGIAENFQELGTALAWLGIVMMTMSFAGLMSGLAFIFTGFGNVQAVLGPAIDMILDTVELLNEFKSVKVDAKIGENLTTVNTAISGITNALLSLVGMRLVSNIGALLTGFGYFGSLIDTFRQAKEDIQQAINLINEMDFTGIDETKVNTIKTTLDAISSFADAFSGLQNIRTTGNLGDLANRIFEFFGGKGQTIQQAFKSAHKDIKLASESLASYSDIEAPPQAVVDKLTKVGDAIKSVSESIEGIRGVRDAYNWDSWLSGLFNFDVKGAFDQAKKDLETVSSCLKDLNIDKMPKGLVKRLKTLAPAVKNVSTVINDAKQVPEVSKAEIGTRMRQAVGGLILARNALSQLDGLEVKNNNGKLTTIRTGVRRVASTTRNMLQVPIVSQAEMGTRMRQAVGAVILARNALSRLQGQETVDVGGILTNIKNGVTKLKNTIKSMNFTASGKHVGSSLKKGMKTGIGNLGTVFRSKIQQGVGGSRAYAFGKRMGQYLTNGFRAGLNLTQVIQEKMAELPSLEELVAGFVEGGTGNEENGNDTSPSYGALDMGMDSVKRYSMLNQQSARSTVNALSTMNKQSTVGKTQRPVTIHIGEGAVKVDANNLTKRESRQVMINALEGLSSINSIDVNGA